MEWRQRLKLFTWQPWLLLAVLSYLLAEIYFLTLLVNSLYYVEHYSDFNQLEVTGRLISGIGLGLSVLIGLSLNKKLNTTNTLNRVSLKLAIFGLVTMLGYIGMKELYLFMERNASKQIIHCSILGNAANRVFSKGTLPEYNTFVASGGLVAYSQKQLVRLYLPMHVCLNDNYRNTLETSATIEVELAQMVSETGLPQKIARPAEVIYLGFRDNLDEFSSVMDKLQRVKNTELESSFIKQNIANFEQFLQSQSRFTRHDATRLSEVYQCALERATEDSSMHAEQRFLLSVSRCLYDVARNRFSSLPEIHKAKDIFKLEQDIAFHWARQFIRAPENIPEEALNLMRKSFALVFLPTYAVLVSTFIVFICLAAYVRTRFLIRAEKLKTRVNPVLNALLSPLVVVPFIWTAIFLWLPRPQVESIIYPANTQTNWVKVIQVTQRPLFYYYDVALESFKQLAIPVSLTTRTSNTGEFASGTSGSGITEFTGFYHLNLCDPNCQSVRLHLLPSGKVANVYYHDGQCTTTLLLDSNRSQSWYHYFETSSAEPECGESRLWRIKPGGDVLNIAIQTKESVSQLQAHNLFL
ncbi:hypothetical protein [Planctobacterium marinum]|uniref:Uncharacterized protein n=1 Tax=Planctobacterium marinum TaxID=1631968 RepID=A0AA48KN62_9ALTE|nr:hypothetical protein MACH26_06970 [Planctobacterium marinum]